MLEFRFPKKYMRMWWALFFAIVAQALFGVAIFVFMVVPAIRGVPLFFPYAPQQRLLVFLAVVGLPCSIAVLSGSSFFASWLLRRFFKSVYLVDEAGLTRVRAGNRARVDFDQVGAVRRKWFGLVLETSESRIAVPSFVESYGQLVRLLKEGIEAAGGAFPEKVYAASLRAAARSKWELDNGGKACLVIAALAVLLAILGFGMGYLLQMEDEGPWLGAGLSAVVFGLLTGALVEWLPSRRFRDAGKPGWEPPGSVFAWRILFLSAGIVLFVCLAAASALLHIFT